MDSAGKKILIIDDEEMIIDLLCDALQQKGFEIIQARNGKTALELMNNDSPDLIITDLRLPDISGMEILSKVKKKYPDVGVIMITAYGSIKNAVKAMKNGAFEYITKPFDLDEIEILVDKFFDYRNLIDENVHLKSELDKKFSFKNIVGSSEPMQQIFESVKMVARSRATVLVTGASGTGKELIARAIHYNSDRKNGPFVTTNCAALPEGLVESELFGHEKGAFTGAIKTNKGRFEMANGGTLLLDEISEITPGIQAKLLRVLQEREVERVGSGKSISVNVRIIATSNRNMQKEVAEKRFREDLFYRLNVVPINMPAIAERREDIPLLVQHFVKKYSLENGFPIKRVSEKTMKVLMQRDWPGNVREIENCVERAVVMSATGNDVLDADHFFLPDQKSIEEPVALESSDMTLREIEKSIILSKLREYNQNRTKTAEMLGISVRTLRNKLNEYRTEGVNC